MGSVANPDPGYRLPAVIDPGELTCIPVYVPNATEYIAAFFGSLEYLTTWLAWERDPEKRGRDAAALWKAAFNRTRDEWLTIGCGGTPLMLRQNDEITCWLEQSADGGETWTLAFDYSLCMPETLPPLHPFPADGRSMDAAEMDSILWFLNRIMTLINDLATAGTPEVDIVTQVSAAWQSATGLPAPEELATAVGTWASATEAERLATIGSGSWAEFRANTVCALRQQDVSPTKGHVSWLSRLSAGLADWLNNASDSLARALNATWATLVGQPTAVYNAALWAERQGAGGAGFGWTELSCPPVGLVTHNWDFRGGTRGWVAGGGAFYVPGSGWRMNTTGDYIELPLAALGGLQSCAIDYYFYRTGSLSTGSLIIRGQQADDSWEEAFVVLPPANSTGEKTYPYTELPVGVAAKALRVFKGTQSGYDGGNYILRTLALGIAYPE